MKFRILFMHTCCIIEVTEKEMVIYQCKCLGRAKDAAQTLCDNLPKAQLEEHSCVRALLLEVAGSCLALTDGLWEGLAELSNAPKVLLFSTGSRGSLENCQSTDHELVDSQSSVSEFDITYLTLGLKEIYEVRQS